MCWVACSVLDGSVISQVIILLLLRVVRLRVVMHLDVAMLNKRNCGFAPEWTGLWIACV